MSGPKQTQIVSVIDLDVAEREDIERTIQKASEVGGYLHIEVRVVAPVSADDRERDFVVVDDTLRKACYGPGSPGLSIREHAKAQAALLRLVGRDPAHAARRPA